MNEREARSALLLRAYESAPASEHWNEEDGRWATRAALEIEGERAHEAAFLARRAALAAERLCARAPQAARLMRALRWRRWVGWALGGAALAAGIATDAIGPAQRINILAPPLLALLAWNLAVYAAMLLRLAGVGARRGGALAQAVARAARGLVPARLAEGGASPLADFARDWMRASAPLTAARVARILHQCAALVAAGALAGMYVRGLALEYRAGWESTFLDAAGVHALLSVVLAPAAALAGIALPDAAQLAALRFGAAAGGDAAPWIHLYAATLALVVLVPRTLLALGHFLIERRLERRFPLALDDGYFQDIVRARSGAAATVGVLPYGLRPGARAAAGLEALMRRAFGPATVVRLAPALAFGDEDDLDAAMLPAPPVALVAALFPLTATPERENHGALLAALAQRLPPATPLAVLVDESAFRRRFDAALGARRDERRAAWRRMLAESGHAPLFVDLEGGDFGDAGQALRALPPARTARRP